MILPIELMILLHLVLVLNFGTLALMCGAYIVNEWEVYKASSPKDQLERP